MVKDGDIWALDMKGMGIVELMAKAEITKWGKLVKDANIKVD